MITWSSPSYAVGFVVVIAVLAVLTAFHPLAGVVFAAMVAVAGAVLRFRERLGGPYLGLLGVVLAGYALFGRSFAYLGFAPIYVGEIVLVLGVVVLLVVGWRASLVRSPIAWGLVAFMAVGAIATLPHLETHGVDALRDAVVWGYAVFAFIVAGLVRHRHELEVALHRYGGLIPVFLIAAPALTLVEAFAGPRLPQLPGTDIGIVDVKPGDIAVHLAGIMAFVVLALQRAVTPASPIRRGREWLLWLLWLVTFLVTLTSRAAFLAVTLAALLLIVLRPTRRWWKVVALSAAVLILAGGMNLGFELRDGRTVSVQGLAAGVASIVVPVEESNYQGTRNWRLQWWEDIVQYTVFGEHFWTGKGYGINLADSDGYQVLTDGTLRSPHNVHMTILARSGVPGFAAWVILQVLFGVSLLRAYLRRRAEGRNVWADLNLFVLAYWLAFLINASFDVYLEGPQGGIWFWSVVGFGMALLRLQDEPDRDQARVPRARPSPRPGGDPARTPIHAHRGRHPG